MLIAALKEQGNETRTAITPSTVRLYIKAGFSVTLEQHAGLKAGFSDQDYEAAGGVVMEDVSQFLSKTNILLSLNNPNPERVKQLSRDALLIGSFSNDPQSQLFDLCRENQLSLLSMNYIPRISRAQSMDSLSSQSNLAGYRAVLEACIYYHRAIPMMMTAAGMIEPAKILVLGAGVAGLQAIATAKRLGAVVTAFDVRRVAKEQVESLGATFIEVSEEDAASDSGYAKETSEMYKKQQALLIDEQARISDIIIATALIPDRPAPVLLFKETLDHMKRGSVIVDLATSRGGNCEASKLDTTIQYGPVTIVGNSNLPGLIPTTASELYANNLVHLLKLLTKEPGQIYLNPEDEIIRQSVLIETGCYLPFSKT